MALTASVARHEITNDDWVAGQILFVLQAVFSSFVFRKLGCGVVLNVSRVDSMEMKSSVE